MHLLRDPPLGFFEHELDEAPMALVNLTHQGAQFAGDLVNGPVEAAWCLHPRGVLLFGMDR
jgi:hypothetical protein